MTVIVRNRDEMREEQQIISDIVYGIETQLVISGMGSGKTGATLDGVKRLLDELEVRHVLVIAPMFVAKNTWPDEIEAWSHIRALSVETAVGDPIQRRAAIDAKAEITTINFENLVWLAKYIGSIRNWYWDCVIIDESSRFKAGESRTKATTVTRSDGTKRRTKGGRMTRFGVMTTARKMVKRVIELTGTPAPKGVVDLWGQIYLLDQGEALGRSKSSFEAEHFNQNKYTRALEIRDGAEENILNACKHLITTIPHRQLVEEPRMIPMKVKLPKNILADYREFEKTLYSEAYDVEAVSRGVLANKLLQFANGHMYKEDRSVIHIHDMKMEALDELIESANGENIMCFYGFKFDKDAIKKRYPHAVIANESSDFIGRWNKGKIKLLLAHPACLHGDTEVLTELRGWVRIIDVLKSDKVFDGFEFVSHDGCSYSGYKPTIDVFGIKMTPDHKLLINGKWEEASNVGTDKSVRDTSRYRYSGNDRGVGKMFEMRKNARDGEAELCSPQQNTKEVLLPLRFRQLSQIDRNSNLENLEWDESQSVGQKRPKLLRARYKTLPSVGKFYKFLRRYEGRLWGQANYRASRCKQRLQQGQLHLGNPFSTAGKQANKFIPFLQRFRLPPGRTLSNNRSDEIETSKSSAKGNGRGGGRGRCFKLNVWNRSTCSEDHSNGSASEMQDVYDLVNCGKRHQFVIRNSKGECFISHNSIGHGTNLQYGGHIATWFGLTFSLELWLQANMRLPRPGQTKQVLIYPIIAEGTYDERALKILKERDVTQDRIIESFLRERN